MPPYPDETLPVAKLSLRSFNRRAYKILKKDLRNFPHKRFVEFVLGGRLIKGDGVERRVYMDVLRGIEPTAALENLNVTRDYDSLIGISENLPFNVALALYPVPNFRESLKRTNHLTKRILVTVSHMTWNISVCKKSMTHRANIGMDRIS